MISRACIIQCAQTYVNTPFRMCGRKKGSRIDCGGLLELVAREIGQRNVKGPERYSRYPDGETLQAEIDKWADPICPTCAGPGDIVGYWWEREGFLQHVGILSPAGIIHAWIPARKVVETSIPQPLRDKLMLAWSFRDVEPLDEFDPDDLTDMTDPLRYKRRGCGCK